MKASTAISSLATAGIVGLGALGIYGVQSAQATRDELAVSTELAGIVLSAKDANSSENELASLAEKQLATLPSSALKLAENREQNVSQGSTPEAVAEELYTLAQQNPSAPERAQALAFSAQWWQASDSAGKAPSWLSEDKDGAGQDSAGQESTGQDSTCQPSDTQAPASVTALASSINASAYASQLFDARKELENYSDSASKLLTASVKNLPAEQQEMSEAISCNWVLPAQQASYPLTDAADPLATLTAFEDQTLANAQAVLADPEVPLDSQIFAFAADIVYSQKK